MTIRLAIRQDLDGLVSLYAEMDAQFFAARRASKARIREGLEAALFGRHPAAEALVAQRGDRFVGLAIFSLLFPGVDASTTAFIMELFVRASDRGGGVGRALMAALAELALERGYSRLEWTTEAHNEAARAFYRRYQATEDARVFYRMDRAALQKMMQGRRSGSF